MAKKSSKRTRKLQFDTKTRKKIMERDYNACIFCMMGYPAEKATWLDLEVKDIMHFIPRARGGLGIEQNGAVGCRYHHSLLDNGNTGAREEMLKRFETYLRSIYPNWNKENLIYKKYNF